mgnify:CR=1 FL=1
MFIDMDRISLNSAQLEILEMTSFVQTQEMLTQMKKDLATHFANIARQEVEQLWNYGTLNEEKVESFRTLHERTRYE